MSSFGVIQPSRRWARRITHGLVVVSAAGLLASCSVEEPDESASDQPANGQSEKRKGPTITQKNVRLLERGGDLEGATVKGVVGQVFNVDRSEAEGVAVQMWLDEDNENQAIVGIKDPGFEVDEGDYLKVTGTVGENFEGENAFGADLTAPTIAADEAELAEADDMFPPRFVADAQTQELAGLEITIRKIEFAENETRLYLKVTNRSAGEDATVDTDPKVVSRGQQMETEYVDRDYPDLSYELSPGATTTGVLVFPRMPRTDLRISFSGYDAEYNEVSAVFEY